MAATARAAFPGTYNLNTGVEPLADVGCRGAARGNGVRQEPYVCAVLDWRFSPTLTSSNYTSAQAAAIQAFDDRSDVKAALAQVLAAAKSRPATRCK